MVLATTALVGSPAYLAQHPQPETPYQLTGHRCINIRHRPNGSIYAWEFEQDGREFSIKLDGQIVFNSIMPVGVSWPCQIRLHIQIKKEIFS